MGCVQDHGIAHCRDIYDEFFPMNKLLLDKKRPEFLRHSSKSGYAYLTGQVNPSSQVE